MVMVLLLQFRILVAVDSNCWDF